MNDKVSANISWLFDAAYDEIDSEGWATGTSSHPWHGPCCMGHALIRVAKRSGRTRFIRPALDTVTRHTGTEFWRWNDRQTDELRVLALLERLADTYRRVQ